MALNNFTFAEICQMIIVPAFFDTLKMLVISGVLSTFLGFFVGVILIITEKGGLCENVVVNRILDFIVNTVRSFPFIILMVSIIPFTRLIVGTSIGDTAALVPLTVAVTPFMGRIFQNSFKEVDPALIEAAKSFGASKNLCRPSFPACVLPSSICWARRLWPGPWEPADWEPWL